MSGVILGDRKSRHRTHQWQKSLETTQNVSSLARNGAMTFPNRASVSRSIAPTRIGTMDISSLLGRSTSNLDLGIASSPFKYLAYVRQVHFNAVLIFVGLYIHVAKIPRRTQFGDGCVPYSLIEPRTTGRDETHFAGRGEGPRWGSRKSCIWITRNRSDKHGETARERTPAF